MNDKEIKNALVTIKKRTQEAKRKCLFDNCQEIAIDSHLLQKNGIINQISESSLVYKLMVDTYKRTGHKFKALGLKEAFAFPGFCPKHDNDIFKEIESTNFEYKDYKTQLLFSYRTLMNEKRKKEINVDFADRILNSFKIKLYLSDKYITDLTEHRKGNLLGIKDVEYYEERFLSNIKDKNLTDFSFITFELPKMDICVSAVFTYETSKEINEIHQTYLATKPLTDVYINIFPIANKTIFIMGCLGERKDKCWDYIQSFDTSETNKILKKLSDLMLCQIENWICSPKIYKTYLQQNEIQIQNIYSESKKHWDERRELNFNLFENWVN